MRAGAQDAIRIWVDGEHDEINVAREDLNDRSILNDTPASIGCLDVGGVPTKGAIDEAVRWPRWQGTGSSGSLL